MIKGIKKLWNKMVGNYYVPEKQNLVSHEDPKRMWMTVNRHKNVAWHTDLTKEEAERACKVLNKRMNLV